MVWTEEEGESCDIMLNSGLPVDPISNPSLQQSDENREMTLHRYTSGIYHIY